MKKRKLKRLTVIIGTFLMVLIALFLFYIISLNAISKVEDKVNFNIKSGTSTQTIIKNLKSANIIKNENIAFIYAKLNKLKLQAGDYTLDRSDNTQSILKLIASGKTNNNTITVTFVEGKRVTDYAKIISEKFNYDYDEVLAVFKDKSYAKELIGKYSFLSEQILNNEIYYPLEGYLYPDTYSFYKTSSIKEIIEKIIKEENNKLNSLKNEIDASNISIFDLVTSASVVEMEGTNASNRANIAQVINTRIEKNMNLGMDVTTYYAVQKNMTDVLTKKDLASTSKYNTRLTSNLGLPVGPICNPSMESIMAVLNPSNTNFIYFYASKDGHIYFTSDYNEFLVFKNNG